jgi:hypothetical protein
MSQDIEDRFPKEVVPLPAEIDLAVPELGVQGSGLETSRLRCPRPAGSSRNAL